MSTKEGYERAQAIRKEHMIHLVLTKLLCDIQVKAGQHFHFEQPAGSAALQQEPSKGNM